MKREIKQLESNLTAILERFNKTIELEFKKMWRRNIAGRKNDLGAIADIFEGPRNAVLNYCVGNGLNYSSIAGTFLEWTILHFLRAAVVVLKKDSRVEVINRHQINFIWKAQGIRKLNLDIVVKSKMSKKIYFAFEVKTNFDDGFQKYRDEEKIIYHHRTKGFKWFKYYYLTLYPPSRMELVRRKRDINTLVKRNELFVLKTGQQLPGLESLLSEIKMSLEKIDSNE